MSRQSFSETMYWATADGTPVANTTTETALFPAFSIPPNFLQDGRVLRMSAYGKLSTTGTPTITFAIRLGGALGTLLATTEALTMGSGVANVNWAVEALLTVRSNGAGGTVIVSGKAFVHTAAGTVLMNVIGVSGYDAPAAVAVDLTIEQDLVITADWSAASSSNTATGVQKIVEALN